jgi:hypothetical protein
VGDFERVYRGWHYCYGQESWLTLDRIATTKEELRGEAIEA